jgi:hypothetical protein
MFWVLVSYTSKSTTVLRIRKRSSMHQSKKENDNKEVIRMCVGVRGTTRIRETKRRCFT